MFTLKKSNRLSKDTLIDYFEILPLIISLAIIPLIVFLKVSPTEGGTSFWKSDVDYDFFSYYKSISLISTGVLSLIIMLWKAVKSSGLFKKTNMYLPLFLFLIFVVLSALFSDYQKISWLGFYNRYEGALAIISYAILFIYSLNFVNKKSQIKIILTFFIISAVIIITIGVFQFFKMDFFRTDFGKRLMLPNAYESQAMYLTLQVEESMVFSTFKHPNYYGSYMTIVLPFIGSFIILSKQKKHTVLFGILFAAAFFTLMGSRSRAGLLGVFISFLVLFILLRKTIFKKWKQVLIILLIGLFGLFLTDHFTGGVILAKIRSITSDPRISINKLNLEDIIIEDSSLKIISSNSYLEIENVGNYGIAFKDKKGEYLFYTVDKNSNISFQNSKYSRYSLQFANHTNGVAILFNYGDLSANFLITQDSFKFIDPANEPVDLQKIPSWGFKGKELWGSSRGYIWSRTIPMIGNTLFIGNGPDTFSIYFPQNDYVGKMISYGKMNIIVDKAHNMYLQTAVNTGIISLIALMIFFSMYVIWSIILYTKRPPDDLISHIGAAILFSVIGYLTAGFFNDSVVSVSTVFWVLLGIGTSINLKISKNSKEESK